MSVKDRMLDLAAQSITPETYQAYAQQIAGSAGILPVADRLVFFCVMVRKRVFDQLGGLASAFGLGNYEDDDFCLRARMAGHTLSNRPRLLYISPWQPHFLRTQD